MRKGKERKAHIVLVGKPDGNGSLRKCTHRWEIILRWILDK
jgi:hypothetical protein